MVPMQVVIETLWNRICEKYFDEAIKLITTSRPNDEWKHEIDSEEFNESKKYDSREESRCSVKHEPN